MADISHTATIVSAYLRNHDIAADQISSVIGSVHAALAQLGNPIGTALPVPAGTPAVSVRRSVRPEAVICLECGYKGQMLKRHLSAQHGLSADAYRAKWGLPSTYPVVAPNYALKRSSLAKQIGLGRR